MKSGPRRGTSERAPAPPRPAPPAELANHLRAVLDHAPVVLFAVDREGVITLSEGRGLEALGLRPGEVVGRPLWELYPESEEIRAHVRRALGGESFTVNARRDGRVFETRFEPLCGEDGAILGSVGVALDITAPAGTQDRRAEGRLRAREEELRHAQKMDAVGRLAGGVAHDFNNLLTAILGHAQLLVDTLPADDPSHDSALEIQHAGQRAAQLTRQLLSFGRKQPLQVRVHDLLVVLGEVLPIMRAALGEAITLEARQALSEAWVRADRGELEQLMMNLTMNARDAMAESGSLTIQTDVVAIEAGEDERPAHLAAGPYVRVRFTDTGAGMAPEVRARAFEPFFTTKPRGQGLGLGLAMAYATMARCGGAIEVQSEPGRGTTITLLFPRASVPAAGAVETAEESFAEPRAPGGAETLLLVEDEDVVRLLLARMLEGLGYRVITAADADEALEILVLRSPRLDLLITDVVMPGRSGLELTEELRTRLPDLPVICISGYTEEELTRRILGTPSVTLLLKPFAPVTLARLVRERLDQRRPAGPA